MKKTILATALMGIAAFSLGISSTEYFAPVKSWARKFTDDPAVRVCETFLIKGLVSPRSYERVGASVYDDMVSIEYDAQNRMGTWVRGREHCPFSFYDGRFKLAQPESMGSEDILEKQLDSIQRLTAGMDAGPILAGKTKLIATVVDAAVDQCIRTAVGSTEFPLMPFKDDMWIWNTENIKDPQNYSLVVEGRKQEAKRIPRTQCIMSKGSLSIKRL